MNYSIFLDDERYPSDKDQRKYTIVRNYKDFVWYIENWRIPEFITFDHDLGEEKNGYHCAKYLIDHMLNKNINQKINYQIHSQNPVGAKNIQCLVDSWNKVVEKL